MRSKPVKMNLFIYLCRFFTVNSYKQTLEMNTFGHVTDIFDSTSKYCNYCSSIGVLYNIKNLLILN